VYHSTKLLVRWGWEVIKDRDSLKHVNKVIANTPLGLLCLLHVFFQLAQSTADRKGTAIRLAKGLRIRKWAAFKTHKKCGRRAARGFAARFAWRLRRQTVPRAPESCQLRRLALHRINRHPLEKY